MSSWFAAVMILVLGGVIYLNSLPNPFVFDDLDFIVANPDIRRLWPPDWARATDLPHASLNGRPLISLSLALNFAAGELEVRGYRLVNLAAHLASALALLGVLNRCLRQGWAQRRFGPASGPYLASAVALLWMAHPLHSECINYISQRSETMMAFSFLMTFYCLLRGSESKRIKWYCGAIFFGAFGTMCKEVMATVPLLALLFDRTFIAGSFAAALRRRWGLYLGLMSSWLLLLRQLWSEPHIGMIGFSSLNSWDYALNQCVVLTRYVKVMFWPNDLLLDYGPPVPRSLADVFPEALVVTALLAITIAALRRRPHAGFSGAWCFVILAPTSSFLPILTEVGAERRLYLPSAGFLSLVVLLIAAALFRNRDSGNRLGGKVVIGWLMFAAALGVFAFKTVERNREYGSAMSIWQTVVERAPQNHRGHNNLGVALAAAGELDRAMKHYIEALRIHPDYTDALINLGNALTSREDWGQAIAHYRHALSVKPEIAELHYNLARALAATGQTAGAVEHYVEALHINPDYIKALNNLGVVYLSEGDADRAIDHFEAVIDLDPGFAGAYLNFGIALEAKGQLSQARKQYQEAHVLRPDWELAGKQLSRIERALDGTHAVKSD